jgi:hypothetical protein
MAGRPVRGCPIASPQHAGIQGVPLRTCSHIGVSFITAVEGHYLTYRQRYKKSTGRDPFICPHCRGERGLWRIWHPTYGVIYDEGEVIKRGTYTSTAQRAGP